MGATLTLSNGTTTLALPDLIWEDEGHWDPLAQSRTYSLTGALVIEEAGRLAGRPVTLAGGASFAWLTRADVALLRALGATAGATLTLTLLDDRTLTVTPRRDGEGGAWIEARPLPVVLDSGPADPSDATRYVLDKIRLIEV